VPVWVASTTAHFNLLDSQETIQIEIGNIEGKMKNLIQLLSATVLLLTSSYLEANPVYTATRIDPFPGAVTSRGLSINENGQVAVGACCGTRAFILDSQSGIYSELNPFGITGWRTINSINNNGWATGEAQHPDGQIYAYVFDGTNSFQIPGVGRSVGFHINDANQVMGMEFSGPLSRSFLWQDGVTTFVTAPVPPFISVTGVDLNNFGQILINAGSSRYVFDQGSYFSIAPCASTGQGYGHLLNDRGDLVIPCRNGLVGDVVFRSEGQDTVLAVLSGTVDPFALALNNNRQLVGRLTPKAGSNTIAALWMGTSVYDLNSLLSSALPNGVRLTSAQAINDLGFITALGSDNFDYLLTPDVLNTTPIFGRPVFGSSAAVPEPGSLFLGATGLLVLLTLRKRR
jgi:uncharacterized membrane protein